MHIPVNRHIVGLCVVMSTLLGGCPPKNSPCGDLDPFSMHTDSPGSLTIDLSGGPADGSLLLHIAGNVYVGSPVQAGAEPTTYEFFNLPSGNWPVTWEISGCEDQAVPIDGPLSVTIQ